MSAQTQTLDRTRDRIERLIRDRLVPRQSDIVAMVDELLSIAAEGGEIRATISKDHRLRFEFGLNESCEFESDLARSRLRTICARLAKIVQESGQEFLPYGGEGIIRMPGTVGLTNGAPKPMTWKARWKNTTDAQEFVIQAL